MFYLVKFKPINDTDGHDAGDEVIRDFTRRTRRILRSDDWIARRPKRRAPHYSIHGSRLQKRSFIALKRKGETESSVRLDQALNYNLKIDQD